MRRIVECDCLRTFMQINYEERYLIFIRNVSRSVIGGPLTKRHDEKPVIQRNYFIFALSKTTIYNLLVQCIVIGGSDVYYLQSFRYSTILN